MNEYEKGRNGYADDKGICAGIESYCDRELVRQRAAEFRGAHGSDFGRVMDKSAHDHMESVKAAVEGRLGGELLDQIGSFEESQRSRSSS